MAERCRDEAPAEGETAKAPVASEPGGRGQHDLQRGGDDPSSQACPSAHSQANPADPNLDADTSALAERHAHPHDTPAHWYRDHHVSCAVADGSPRQSEPGVEHTDPSEVADLYLLLG